MFFSQIDRMMSAGVDLNITITKLGEQLTVAMMPKARELKDVAQAHMTPLLLTGLPAELDAEFFNVVSQPVAKATGLLVNLKQFEDSAEQMRKSSQTVKSPQVSKPAPPKEDKATHEKREKYEKHLNYGERLASEGKFGDAVMQFRAAVINAPDEQTKQLIAEKIRDAQQKANECSLFGGITSQSQPAMQPQASASAPIPTVQPVQQPMAQPIPQGAIPHQPQPRPIQQSAPQPMVQGGLFGSQSVPQTQQVQQPQARQVPPVQVQSPEYPQATQPVRGMAPNTADFPAPGPRYMEPQFSMPAAMHPAEAFDMGGYTEDPEEFNPDMPEDFGGDEGYEDDEGDFGGDSAMAA